MKDDLDTAIDGLRDIAVGIDGLQADMAEHQRRFAGEVTAERNRELAVAAMTRLEREWADAVPPPPPITIAPPAHVPETVAKRTIDDRTYTLTKGSDATKFRAPTKGELWFMQRAMPRVELLLTKLDRGALGQPSWAERLLAVMALQQQQPTRYLMELIELLEDSNRLFGDWKADPPRRIQVG